MSYVRKSIIENAMVFTAPVGTEFPPRWVYPGEEWTYIGDVSHVEIELFNQRDPQPFLHGFRSENNVAVYMAGYRPGNPDYKRAYFIWELKGTILVKHPEHVRKEYGIIVDRKPE